MRFLRCPIFCVNRSISFSTAAISPFVAPLAFISASTLRRAARYCRVFSSIRTATAPIVSWNVMMIFSFASASLLPAEIFSVRSASSSFSAFSTARVWLFRTASNTALCESFESARNDSSLNASASFGVSATVRKIASLQVGASLPISSGITSHDANISSVSSRSVFCGAPSGSALPRAQSRNFRASSAICSQLPVPRSPATALTVERTASPIFWTRPMTPLSLRGMSITILASSFAKTPRTADSPPASTPRALRSASFKSSSPSWFSLRSRSRRTSTSEWLAAHASSSFRKKPCCFSRSFAGATSVLSTRPNTSAAIVSRPAFVCAAILPPAIFLAIVAGRWSPVKYFLRNSISLTGRLVGRTVPIVFSVVRGALSRSSAAAIEPGVCSPRPASSATRAPPIICACGVPRRAIPFGPTIQSPTDCPPLPAAKRMSFFQSLNLFDNGIKFPASS